MMTSPSEHPVVTGTPVTGDLPVLYDRACATFAQILINGEEMRGLSSLGQSGTWASSGSTAWSFHARGCGLGPCWYLSDRLVVVIRSRVIDQLVRAICLAFPEATERPSHGAPAFFAGKQFVALRAGGNHDDNFP